MAAQANTIKKYMNVKAEEDGTINMMIHVQIRPDQLSYVNGYPCGSLSEAPRATALAIAETVTCNVTELMKIIDKDDRLTALTDPNAVQFNVVEPS